MPNGAAISLTTFLSQSSKLPFSSANAFISVFCMKILGDVVLVPGLMPLALKASCATLVQLQLTRSYFVPSRNLLLIALMAAMSFARFVSHRRYFVNVYFVRVLIMCPIRMALLLGVKGLMSIAVFSCFAQAER